MAEFRSLLCAHDQHGGCAIGDLRRVAGRDLAVFGERRLEVGQGLGCGVGADAFVLREHLDLTIDVDGNRDDLSVETTLGGGLGGPLLALGRERVEVLAGEAVFVGDHVGTDALRRQTSVLVPLEHLRTEGHAEFTASGRRPHRGACHRLDTEGDDHVVGAGHDALGGKVIACWLEPHWRSTVVAGPTRASRRRGRRCGRC